MSMKSRENIKEILHIQPDIFSYRWNVLTIWKLKYNVLTLTFYRKWSVGSQNDNRLSQVTTNLKLRRNKRRTIAPARYSPEDIIAFDTSCQFYNVPYKRPHTTETTALSKSWKKTPTAIGVSVSKLYVTFCGAAAKLKARVTVCCCS